MTELGQCACRADMGGVGLTPGKQSSNSPYRLVDDTGYRVHPIRLDSWLEPLTSMCRPEMIPDPVSHSGICGANFRPCICSIDCSAIVP